MHTFFWHLFFSHKIEISYENGPQNKPKVDICGSCFQKMRENRKVRFDCTGAYGLHLSPHRGVPRATQNYIKKQTDSRNLFFLRKIRKYAKSDTRKVSKWVSLFLANVPWAPLWTQLVPYPVLEDEKDAQSDPRVPTELKIAPKSVTEGPQKIKK